MAAVAAACGAAGLGRQAVTKEGYVGVDSAEVIEILYRDAIPSIDDPRFNTAEAASDGMTPDEFVIGVSIDGEHRAYPVNILSRHEIVNDRIADRAFAVTW